MRWATRPTATSTWRARSSSRSARCLAAGRGASRREGARRARSSSARRRGAQGPGARRPATSIPASHHPPGVERDGRRTRPRPGGARAGSRARSGSGPRPRRRLRRQDARPGRGRAEGAHRGGPRRGPPFAAPSAAARTTSMRQPRRRTRRRAPPGPRTGAPREQRIDQRLVVGRASATGTIQRAALSERRVRAQRFLSIHGRAGTDRTGCGVRVRRHVEVGVGVQRGDYSPAARAGQAPPTEWAGAPVGAGGPAR